MSLVSALWTGPRLSLASRPKDSTWQMAISGCCFTNHEEQMQPAWDLHALVSDFKFEFDGAGCWACTVQIR